MSTLLPGQGAARHNRLAVLIVLAMAALSVGSLAGYMSNIVRQHNQNLLMTRMRLARLALDTVTEAQVAMRGYVLTGRSSYLQSFYGALTTLTTEVQPTLAAIDAAEPKATPPLAPQLAAQQTIWNRIVSQAAAGKQLDAVAMLGAKVDRPGMDALTDQINTYISGLSAQWERRRAALDFGENLFLILNAAGGIGTILALVYAFRRSSAEATRCERARDEALHAREAAIASREEVRKIFAMAQALQSVDALADGAAILRASAIGLLPRLGGALYVFNDLRDRLDLVIAWSPDAGEPAGVHPFAPPPSLLAHECWALKRNKPHLNGEGAEGLRCCHAPASSCSLEVPLAGRGEPIGLLTLIAADLAGAPDLQEATDIACVLADSMSLGLSSIMLRDRLRERAVRDGLTGLYNRRFLEEVLQSLLQQAQRRHGSLAAIMIDLDHFKRLNDEHGHATGDAVLKMVSATLLGALRASDVACRYGGEELLVLLPDCTLEMARGKAEVIRTRIAALSRESGPTITASLGVAAFPGTARDGVDLLASADAALYRAKQQGRNRVAAAAQPLRRADEPRPAASWGAAFELPPPLQDVDHIAEA